jgi:hypothetical protein
MRQVSARISPPVFRADANVLAQNIDQRPARRILLRQKSVAGRPFVKFSSAWPIVRRRRETHVDQVVGVALLAFSLVIQVGAARAVLGAIVAGLARRPLGFGKGASPAVSLAKNHETAKPAKPAKQEEHSLRAPRSHVVSPTPTLEHYPLPGIATSPFTRSAARTDSTSG